jgi:hypothetical protein
VPSSMRIMVLLRRLQRSARGAMFEKYPLVFYGTVCLFLLFFAVGAVHELIPGLCDGDEEGEEDCPFCRLVYASVLIAVAVVCGFVRNFACTHLCRGQNGYTGQARYPHYLLRAPPAL